MRATEDELRTWMIAGLDGDAMSHMALLSALVPVLHAFFRRRIGHDNGDVDDLVQDVLIAVHDRRGTFDRDRSFTPWLFAIARYKLIDYFRRARRHVPLEGLENVLCDTDFELAAAARIDVDALLATLPAKQAEAIRATRIEGASVVEASAAAGIGESDTKVSVHRGIKALIERIAGPAR